VKKTSLFLVLMLITVIGAGTASFAACTASSLSNGTGVWGIESYGQAPGPVLDNVLIQATFTSGGTFTGTEWQSLGGTLSSFAVSGTWAMGTPASACQGKIAVTSPSAQTFNFALNTGTKDGTLVQIDLGYTMAGFMVAQGTVTCTGTLFKKKQFSLYSNGYIPAVGGLVTGTGELKFDVTGTNFNANPTVTLDLGAAGNFVVPANGTTTLAADCTGTGVLAVPALGQSFSVDTVVVNAGKEVLWIVTNPGDNVSGYFLQ
jgi:hypothetical protein